MIGLLDLEADSHQTLLSVSILPMFARRIFKEIWQKALVLSVDCDCRPLLSSLLPLSESNLCLSLEAILCVPTSPSRGERGWMGQGMGGTERFCVSSCNDRKNSSQPRINECVMHVLTNFCKFPFIFSIGNGKNVFYRFGFSFCLFIKCKKGVYITSFH